MPSALLHLPHTPGCLACGRANPHGLHLQLDVDEQTGIVTTRFTPTQHHIGFQGVVHGGVLATVLDEAMVWAATWAGRRFCLCGEMAVRYRRPAEVGRALVITAEVEQARGRLVTTRARVVVAASDALVTEASGKYVPLPDEQNAAFVATLVDEPLTAAAAERLQRAIVER